MCIAMCPLSDIHAVEQCLPMRDIRVTTGSVSDHLFFFLLAHDLALLSLQIAFTSHLLHLAIVPVFILL